MIVATNHTADSPLDWFWVALEFAFALSLLALFVGGLVVAVRAARRRGERGRTDS